MLSILYNMGEKYCGNYSYLWSQSHFPTILWSPRNRIWVMWNISWCTWTKYSPIKRYRKLYGRTLYILYNMGEKIVVIIHIYGTIAISLLFCVHQDTESFFLFFSFRPVSVSLRRSNSRAVVFQTLHRVLSNTRFCPYWVTCIILGPSIFPATLLFSIQPDAPPSPSMSRLSTLYWLPPEKRPEPPPPPLPTRSYSPLPSPPLRICSVPRSPTTVGNSEPSLTARLRRAPTNA